MTSAMNEKTPPTNDMLIGGRERNRKYSAISDLRCAHLYRILPQCVNPSERFFSFNLYGKSPRQLPVRDVFELLHHADAAAAQGGDAYFALASFADGTNRTQANAVAARSLWADIDVGKPASKYKNRNEALSALWLFVKATGLKPGIIISSGMGLHVYWTFWKNIPIELWRGMAAFFHRLCVEQGLDVDPTRAEDPASVLRVPGTIHQKTGSVVTVLGTKGPIYHAKDFMQRVYDNLVDKSDARPLARVTGTKPALAIPNSMKLAEATGFIEPPTADAEKIVRQCRAVLSAGLGTYPQWFAMMSVMKRCANGREWAHKLSSFDKGRYDYGDTEKKFNAAHYDAPALCSTFENICPRVCTSCPHHGKIKTPVQLSKLIISEPVEPPVQPEPAPEPAAEAHEDHFGTSAPAAVKELVWPSPAQLACLPLVSTRFFQKDDGVYMKVPVTDDQTGETKYVDKRIINGRIQLRYCVYDRDETAMQDARSFVFSVWPTGGYAHDVIFNVREHMRPDAIVIWLYNSGANPADPYTKPSTYIAFMNAYLNSVQGTVPELRTYDRFGWVEYKDRNTQMFRKGFLTGAGLITEDGFADVRFGDLAREHANRDFVRKGSLEKWKAVPQMYRLLKQEIGQLAVCMSLAGPLMPYGSGEAKNAILSIWSAESGKGKSQLLRTCASIWGNPATQFFTRMESSVARARRLAIWQNIPGFMDELTDLKDDDLFALAYTLTGGKEKQKLKSSGDAFVKTGDWSTVVISTANRSFKEAISRCAGDSEATLQRVMEYCCDFESYEDQPVVQKYINACMTCCNENYGWAGPTFLHYIMQRPDLLDTLTIRGEHWFLRHKFDNKERFMGYALFLALQAGRWANECGLLDYDMDALEKWVLKEFVPQNRKGTQEFAPDFMESMATFLLEKSSETLVVKRDMRDEQTEPDPMSIAEFDKFVIRYPASYRDITVRIETEAKAICVAVSKFNDWCRARNLSPKVVKQELAKKGIRSTIKVMSLTRSLKALPTPYVRCMVFDATAFTKLGFAIDVGPVIPPAAGQ